MKRAQYLLACAVAAAAPAHAQVFSGVSDSGSIVLSSQEDDAAHTLLIAAEPVAKLDMAEPQGVALPIPAAYEAFVREASQTYSIPAALIHALILVESNYNPRALSRKGAQGLMQLMPGTARRFGLANGWDPRQNILAGTKYLRWLLDTFGEDMELSLAAYNAGEGAVLQAGRRIPPFAETAQYVPRVMALYRRVRQT